MDNKKIEENKYLHDKVALKYTKLHPEIYNSIEQNRLAEKLHVAVKNIRTTGSEKKILDYGSGAGNLISHFLHLTNFSVTGADVSEEFLKLIKSRFASERLTTDLVNGYNLENYNNDEFDMVASYSVLHHVPDYLHIVKEMCRVLKPGGILFIDHEFSPLYWNYSQEYVHLKNLNTTSFTPSVLLNLFRPNWYIRKYKKLRNPRFQSEGDIHVWPDDHIEWDKIEKIINEKEMSIIVSEDYLLYRPNYPKELYEQYADKCADVRLLIARKE